MSAVDDLLARGRAAAEALMVDTCTIRRRTGETTGPGGVVTPTYEVLYGPDIEPYRGRCRIQQPQSGQSVPETPGEAYVLMVRLVLQLPMAVAGLQTEDEVTIESSRNDPDLPGRVFLLRDLAHKTHATARRIGVQERTS